MLRDVGFVDVLAKDRTMQLILVYSEEKLEQFEVVKQCSLHPENLFMQVLEKELAVVEDREAFICDFSEEDYNDIVNGWKAKLVRSSSGELRWGLFVAVKKLIDAYNDQIHAI
ncbi:hypothetical protein V2J09_006462 [Rumex salicifolius]